jgi:hypothetical protein
MIAFVTGIVLAAAHVREKGWAMIGSRIKSAMTAQPSDEYWQKLADETRREVGRITNLRNLLNLQDLADRAVECDRKALLAKCIELRNTLDLGERYRELARKASQQKQGSFAKPHVEEIAARPPGTFT